MQMVNLCLSVPSRVVVSATPEQIDDINTETKKIVKIKAIDGTALGIDSYRLDGKHIGAYKLGKIVDVVKRVTGVTTATAVEASKDLVKADISAGIPLPASAAIQGDILFAVDGISLANIAGVANKTEERILLAGLVEARIVSPEAEVKIRAYAPSAPPFFGILSISSEYYCDFSAVPAKVVMYKEEFVTDTPGQFETAFKTLQSDQTAVIVVINKTDEEIMQALIQANLSEEWGNRIVVMGVEPESVSAQAFGRLFGDKNMYDLRGKKVEDILKDKDLVEGLKGAV